MVSMIADVLHDPINPETGKPRFEFIAGWLAVDFCNTINYAGINQNERLKSYRELVLWGYAAGTLDEANAIRLMDWGAHNPEEAAAVVGRARQLREALHRMIVDEARGRALLQADVDAINAALGPALARLRLTRDETGFRLGWDTDGPDADRMVWPVAQTAMELLSGRRWSHVRQCGGRGCSWVFLDLSRNHSRRWCAMKHCGNRTKVRRHYLKSR